MQRGNIQLEGLQFPNVMRDQGTSVELLKTKNVKDISKWADDNRLAGDKPWGVISRAKAKQEDLFLVLGFRKQVRTRLVFKEGRVERKQEETTEPEIGEFHLRSDGLLELYSCGAKLRSGILHSFSEEYGKEATSHLYLPKESMQKLMNDSMEVLSISLSGLGNPFFSDATLAGPDPASSKTCKELMASGDVKAFRAKYGTSSEGNSSTDVLMVTVYNNCRTRFFPGQGVQSQSDIEEFLTRVYQLSASTDSIEE